MPNIKSQKDRVRLSQKQTEHNKSMRSALRTTVKKANASIADNAPTMDADVKDATISLAKSGGKGLIHKKNASRKISRMMKKANNAVAQ